MDASVNGEWVPIFEVERAFFHTTIFFMINLLVDLRLMIDEG